MSFLTTEWSSGGDRGRASKPKSHRGGGGSTGVCTISAADKRLDGVYGDHPHNNLGVHLTGGVEDDALWQRLWMRMSQQSTTTYNVPRGRVGRRFVKTLAKEFRGVRDRKWNSERPLVYAKAILQTTPGVKRAKDIRARLEKRMDLWDEHKFRTLVNDVEEEVKGRFPSTRERNEETRARAFNSRVLSGRLRSAVRHLTQRGGGGVLQPDDNCTKAGRPVLEVLQEKHPEMREPDLDNPALGIFESYEDTPTVVPLTVTADTVEKIASRLHGSAGPSGQLMQWTSATGFFDSERNQKHCERKWPN